MSVWFYAVAAVFMFVVWVGLGYELWKRDREWRDAPNKPKLGGRK